MYLLHGFEFSFYLVFVWFNQEVELTVQSTVIQKVAMFSPGIEPGTFCVLDRCDNRYTTKTGLSGKEC